MSEFPHNDGTVMSGDISKEENCLADDEHFKKNN